MRYEFVDRNGVQFVRITLGADVIEREATERDHAEAAAATAAEDSLAAALAQETKERVERENANERRALGDEPAAADPVGQKALEKEFDKQLAHELGEDADNGKKKSHKKAAE